MLIALVFSNKYDHLIPYGIIASIYVIVSQDLRFEGPLEIALSCI